MHVPAVADPEASGTQIGMIQRWSRERLGLPGSLWSLVGTFVGGRLIRPGFAARVPPGLHFS